MNWYYQQDGQQRGPVNEAELDNLFRAGTVRPETLVWREGMANWAPYTQAKSGAAAAATGSVVCSECGKSFPPGDVIQYGDRHVCATCKPVFMQKVREGVPMMGEMDYAGFWIRFAAYIIDSIVTGIVGALLGVVAGSIMRPDNQQAVMEVQIVSSAFGFLLGMAYFIFFNGKYGATPGKMACGIKIVTSAGAPIGYPRAAGRYFAAILSGLICAIGYIMAAFDDEKRTLHDRICDTRVVKK